MIRRLFSLLERNESRRVGGTDTGSTVSDRLVRDTVFAKGGTNHLGFDFNTQHHLTVVDTDDVSDHTGQDADVSAMGLDWSGLVDSGGVGLGLSHLFDEGLVALLDTSSERSSVTRVGHVDELFGGQI